MKFYIILCLLFFYLTSCTLHHYSMNRAPIQIEEISWEGRKKIAFTRSNVPLKPNNTDNLIHLSYNSDSFTKYFSANLDIDQNSNLQVFYNTTERDSLMYPPFVFLWLFSLGVFPNIEEVDVDVSILVKDGNGKVQDYNYKIKEYAINSWLTIPFSILLIPNDSYAHSFVHQFDYPKKFIANQFEKDLMKDMKGGKFAPVSSNYKGNTNSQWISSKSKMAILPITFRYPKDAPLASAIRDKVETVLVNKKVTVVERTRMDEILKELKLSQSGLTPSDQLQIGSMLNATNLILGEILEVNHGDSTVEFSIRNIELESGKIIWKYEFTLDESNLSQSLSLAMKELESKINLSESNKR